MRIKPLILIFPILDTSWHGKVLIFIYQDGEMELIYINWNQRAAELV